MMRVVPLLVILVVSSLMAGCLQFGTSGDDDGEEGTGPGGSSGPDGDGDGDFPPWPALEDAVVRPGVQVVSDSGSCTSNFLFRSPDNETLYLGLAAHCLPGESEDETVDIAGGDVVGRVAYNSWYTMEHMESDPGVSEDTNDFALIEIPEDERHLAHPALLHYGGPTGVAEGGDQGDRVLTYGNTPLRQGVEESNTREGYIVESSDWYTSMYIVTPGLPGDSGSAVLNGQGEALGVLIHLGVAPLAASNGAVNLRPALEFANTHGDIEAELVTWEIIDPGVFPDAS